MTDLPAGVWSEVVGQDAAIASFDAAAHAARLIDPTVSLSQAAAAGSAQPASSAARALSSPSAVSTPPSPAASAAPAGTAGSPLTAPHGVGQQGASSAMTHAWLVTGPPGSGRSVAARAFAAALECTGPEPGCGVCGPCREVMAGSHPDVVRLTTDKLLITMEEVKELIQQAQRRPWTGKWRVLIVEDADRMVERTTNVLLKSIEEPPPQTVWILCTPSADDVLPTIRSRCRNVHLRIPSPEAVAELLVRRDGADPQLAARAARASQSHIGLARHLATDEGAWERRRRLLLAPISLRSVGDAVLAAAELVEGAEAEAKETTATRDAGERAALMRALGLEKEGRIPLALRAQIRQLEENQKRRARRARTDVLDRAMIDLLSFYRDVLARQMGSEVEIVNIDLAEQLAQVAASTTAEQSLARIAAIEECRRRLRSNAAPLLAVEALMVQLRPQAVLPQA